MADVVSEMMLLMIVGPALLSTWMPNGDWAIVLLTMRPNGTAWAMSVSGAAAEGDARVADLIDQVVLDRDARHELPVVERGQVGDRAGVTGDANTLSHGAVWIGGSVTTGRTITPVSSVWLMRLPSTSV